MQLDLFATERPSRPPDEWVTGALPNRTGMHAYTVVIRSPDDPERKHDGDRDLFPHHTLARTKAEDWKPSVILLLKDRGPLTLNAIGVHICDKTSDIVLGSTLETAVWELVNDGRVAFTMAAPVLFRLEES